MEGEIVLFSVIIPTYNRAKYVLNAVNSVLAQTFRDFEVIVIDDGSRDDTFKLFQSPMPNVHYYYKENGGKHTALNEGIKYAKGELIVILDSDDKLKPNALADMAIIWNGRLEKSSICGVIGKSSCNGIMIDKPFDDSTDTISYLDFHFKNSNIYFDCCECIKTDIIKNYLWPIDLNTKFIPESFVTDKIGLKYRLICSNHIWKEVEYLDDGITKNAKNHMKQNSIGFLYDIVSKIDEIFPVYSVSLKVKITFWWTYWNLQKCSKELSRPKVKRVSILGAFVRIITPMINLIKGWNRK